MRAHGMRADTKAYVSRVLSLRSVLERPRAQRRTLEDLKGKIDAAIAQIRAKCAGSTSGRCAKVEQIVDRLRKLKDRLDQLESKLQKGNG